MNDSTNSSAAHKFGLAAKEYAEAKNTAAACKIVCKRTWSEVYLTSSGSVKERESRTDLNGRVQAKEDEYTTALSAENLARGKLDYHDRLFEEYRTESSNRRAEMNLR